MSFFTILQTIFIEPLKLIFEIIFSVANKLTSDAGLSIIVLSLAINVLVLPLYRRADAMQEAARDIDNKLKDGVAHIKKTFTGDERMMILQAYYQQNNYKPTDALNGSVSLLLEIPFFMAAYQFLSGLEILQNSSLGPIVNLGTPDGLLVIGGIAINVLPILMTLINVISSAIYLKGFPLKTKIQLYGMAAFFLVFLYDSPAGLVFYWTLNNLFSLVKTIFYKLKNPLKVVGILASAAGLVALVFGLFFYDTPSIKRKVVVLAMGLAAQLPLAYVLIKSKWKNFGTNIPAPNGKLFFLGSLFLTLLIGFLIPSAVLASSPQEFVDALHFRHPLLYLVTSGALAVGTFLVWLRVFYWLASPAAKAIFDRAVWVLCAVALVDYMAFGTNLGVLSSTLQFTGGLTLTPMEQLINLAVLAVVVAAMLVLVHKWEKAAVSILLTASIAIGGMSVVNMVTVRSSVAKIQDQLEVAMAGTPRITLSKTGKNVIVMMLDRAMGEYIPHMMKEKPELADIFSGFTYYENTISYGISTNLASPAVFGGYEYTPVNINLRSDEALVDKHNESLKVLPVLFDENDYDVTVCDPTYANYQWYPDTSIYDEYPDIQAYVTEGVFSDAGLSQQQFQSNSRNFFVYSIMKAMPLCTQSFIYSGGTYNQADVFTTQVGDSMSSATGTNPVFMDAYNVLCNLSGITQFTQGETGSFLMMTNNATHEPTLLQTPSYQPAPYVNNSVYDEAHTDRFTIGDVNLRIGDQLQMAHYHVNMASLLRLGEWFDYLRENGVYDNTRIILVGDHGRGLFHREDLSTAGTTLELYYPLLMVKDFAATEFTTSQTLMTNADVPTLATADLIQEPINPFTGNKITDTDKYSGELWISSSDHWDAEINNGNTFLPDTWACLQGEDPWDVDNWTFTTEDEVLPAGALD